MQTLSSTTSDKISQCPINHRIIELASELNRFFVDLKPLPGFLNVSHFLKDKHVQALSKACTCLSWRQYAVWSVNEDGYPLKSGFQHINPDWYYLSIHYRADEYPEAFQLVDELMGNQATLQTLEKITGTSLQYLGKPSTLTGWKMGSFLGPHCDSGEDMPTKLVISYSLTEYWEKDFGGSTDFQWQGTDRTVTTWPKRNQATLFIPSQNSTHWVNPIKDPSPEVKRITWTLHYY